MGGQYNYWFIIYILISKQNKELAICIFTRNFYLHLRDMLKQSYGEGSIQLYPILTCEIINFLNFYLEIAPET